MRARLAVILQNRLEMASLHWACQVSGIVVTPLNWRIRPERIVWSQWRGKTEPGSRREFSAIT